MPARRGQSEARRFAVLGLHFFDDAAPRVIVPAVSSTAALARSQPLFVGGHAFLRADQPRLQLALHVAGMVALEIPPHLVDLDGDAAQVGDDEIVLRIEVVDRGSSCWCRPASAMVSTPTPRMPVPME